MNTDFVNSPDSLRQITTEMVRIARAGGADAAEAAALESVSMEVSVRRGALDNMDINREQTLSVTVYVNGGEGSATLGSLTTLAIRQAVEKALTIARAVAPDPLAGIADKAWMATAFPDLALYHPWALSPERAMALARQCEEASWASQPTICREKSGGAAVSTNASLSAYANSHDFSATDQKTVHAISCSATAEKDGMMDSDGWSETCRNPSQLPAAETIGDIAGCQAAQRLGSKTIKDGRAGVLFRAPASHSLIRHFTAAASGGALYRKISWLLDRLDTPIFSDHINIRERPHLPGELCSAAYDNEGVSTDSRDIVTDGVWRGRFLSTYSARKLATKSTGNAGGVHNLDVSAKIVSSDDLPALLGRGLIVTDLMGQGVNPVTGDYSHGVVGFWVESGEIVHPVNEVTIAGNLFDMLRSITVMGDDSMRRGAISCGSLLMPDMMIGGN